MLISCSNDDFPRYLTKGELKNVRITGHRLENQLDYHVNIRNSNKKFDVYGIVVACRMAKDKAAGTITIQLTGVVPAGHQKSLKGRAGWPALFGCHVRAAKGKIF